MGFVCVAVDYPNYDIKSEPSRCSETRYRNVGDVERANGQGFLSNEGIDEFIVL